MMQDIKDKTLEDAKLWHNAISLKDGLVLSEGIPPREVKGEPIRLHFILMGLCQKGTANLSVDTRNLEVHPGDLFFVSERHIIDYYTTSPDFECICFMVSTPFYHSFVLNVKNVSSLLLFSRSNPVVTLTPDETKVFKNYYAAIRDKVGTTTHHYREELVKALMLAMFYDMSNVIWRVEQPDRKAQSRADIIFAKFINLLEQNFKKERFVNWYAKELCITPKYLSDVCKQVSKRTANDWIDSYVILELRVQLKNSTKSIKEIAEELNFPNQSFLGKYFKENVGMSPSEYRKSEEV